jgi:murein DD-endopeptidase MepM/ murein hydrolase activator NlpD
MASRAPDPPATGRSRRTRLATHGVALAAILLALQLGPVPPMVDGAGGRELHAARLAVADARAGARLAATSTARPPATVTATATATATGGRTALLQRQAALDRLLERANRRAAPLQLVDQVRNLFVWPDDPSVRATLQPPVTGIITSGYGARWFPVFEGQIVHEGIDIIALPGSPVVAAADGQVIHAEELDGNGKTVVVHHGQDASGRTLQTVYAHMSVIEQTLGASVSAGDVIGRVGSTGTHSTGPHLHFEVRVEGEPVDPRPWF